MRPHKRDAQDFKTFMQMWRMDAINGLSAKSFDDMKSFVISDEDGDLGEQVYTWGTLQKMYAEI